MASVGKMTEEEFKMVKQTFEDRFKLEELKIHQRELLLEALGVNLSTMKCKYCNAKVDYANCSIFPGKEKGEVIIACDSELCISEWMTEMRD